MRLLSFYAAVTALSFAASADAAAKTAREMLMGVDSGDVKATYYLQGVTNGLMEANVLLRFRGDQPLYCQPPKLAVTSGQAAQIMRDYIREHPESIDKNADVVLFQGLAATFSCSH